MNRPSAHGSQDRSANMNLEILSTHPSQSEISENTPRYASGRTSVLDLCGIGVTVHLGELELGLGADTHGERGVADEVAESLSRECW